MAKIKERRTLAPHRLRALCIRCNWYTHGDNAEYDHLLRVLTHDGMEHMTTEDIEAVARDIMEHSNIDEEQDLLSVMWTVNDACDTVFMEEE
ncbi:MAG: hypothetical protein IKF99_12125 [Oscillospiraceae bacterium]|nr:hypothetical protein [Oscillospiraceae bacterium]